MMLGRRITGFWKAPFFFLSLFLLGCESLPRLSQIEEVRAARKARAIQVVSSEGNLMVRQRSAIDQGLSAEEDNSLLARQSKVLEVLNGSMPTPGDNAEILLDGPHTWQAIWRALESATHHIHIESFIFEELEFASRLSDLLIARQKAGVDVRIIYDSVGSNATPSTFFRRLKAHQIALCEFNPIHLFGGRLLKVNHRDHRKIVVVDGKIAFTGGINFHSVYRSGSAARILTRMPSIEEGWRDTHVQLRGSSVRELQTLFLGTWAKQNCGALPIEKLYPDIEKEGNDSVAIVGSSPDNNLSHMYLLLTASITYARESVWLTTAYFVPDPSTINALKAAARRGVDVRLLLPGITDSALAFHAGRSHYEELLEAGVKIFEQRDVLLHAKTIVVDGVWSSIGSSNFDWRSFCHNDEVNAVFLGEDFGTRMRKVFEHDLSLAHPVVSEEWRNRSPTIKFREWLALKFDYLL
jgi:cardiolipin synthase A/B